MAHACSVGPDNSPALMPATRRQLSCHRMAQTRRTLALLDSYKPHTCPRSVLRWKFSAMSINDFIKLLVKNKQEKQKKKKSTQEITQFFPPVLTSVLVVIVLLDIVAQWLTFPDIFLHQFDVSSIRVLPLSESLVFRRPLVYYLKMENILVPLKYPGQRHSRLPVQQG